MPWKWIEEDIGGAYIRFCDRNAQSKGSHEKVPANFIKNYEKKGDAIDTTYKYQVFWSDDLKKKHSHGVFENSKIYSRI